MENRFGTTTDMIIQEVEENGSPLLLAVDAKGLYLTTQSFVDKRRADPNRYTSARQTISNRLTALGMDPTMLFEENKHLIKTDSGKDTKKVNPLKASKRSMRSA